MNVLVMKPVSIEVSYVEIEVPVRYDEEDIPNNFPGRKGDVWHVSINLHNGDLYLPDRKPFPRDVSCDMCMKVVDGGTYTLRNQLNEEEAKRDGEYVPNFFPEKGGDYLEFKIANGRITNWKQPDPRRIVQFFCMDDE